MERKANQAGVHEEFEPFCKWNRGEDRDILEIHLQDFKKDHLRVQFSNQGILKISGEREIDASKKSRFYKEIPVSTSTYDTSAIQAKFVAGWLQITLPKRVHAPETPKIEQTLKPEPVAPKLDQQPKAEAPPPPPPQPKQEIDDSGIACAPRRRNRAVTVAATAAALAVLAAYVVYIYKSTVGEGDN
ncbi:uncharacterized protein LOC127239961 [Andrographis paniculata]|uniref:uncharacterized protein LOC127239961 n=1 Tax=Andrographis paniculata TaxID=175694 RepID=UPI0021E791E2|nr:uncharacterized protein LOC127239961 [Andrographis paniculata]